MFAEALCIDFLQCDPLENCAWRASTSAHKRLLVAPPGTSGRRFCIAVCQFSSGTLQHGLPAGFVQVTHCQTTHIVVWYHWFIFGTLLSPAHRFSYYTDPCMQYNGHGWPPSGSDGVPGSDHIINAIYTSHTGTERDRKRVVKTGGKRHCGSQVLYASACQVMYAPVRQFHPRRKST